MRNFYLFFIGENEAMQIYLSHVIPHAPVKRLNNANKAPS